MTPARFQTIERIFHSALDCEPDQVEGFLEKACAGDKYLRFEVKNLLTLHERVGDFIQDPVAGLATKILDAEDVDPLVGQTIGHYQLIEQIGAGGMGEVYLATDITTGRKAALKLLPQHFTGDPERLRRFEQEAQSVVALNHPNIVTVYEVGEDRATHYIASELIAGETLRDRLARGHIPVEEALDVTIQVTGALAAAHEVGIVHRDIKPENIMLRPDGYVKVLDFGIAKLTEQPMPVAITDEDLGPETVLHTRLGSIVGTVRYMSPEQARGEPVRLQSDIWSLGTVLYEMLAGRAPFAGDSATEVIQAILTSEPPLFACNNTDIPAELQEIVTRALRKEPNERYSSARELVDALKAVRHRMEVSADSQGLRAKPTALSWIRSRTALAVAIAVVVATIATAYFRHGEFAAPPPEKSIAVLPFDNLSDDKENSHFADGIQDDVLTSLAKIHDLKVISRSSVMAYQKSGERNMRKISQALGVANVLEGSVRRTGNRVLLNVQLIDARNDRHLWSERYDRTVADSIGLQGELAMQIAAALKATLVPEEKARLGVDPTTSSEAYVLYLTALGKEGKAGFAEDIAAEQLYVRATAIDPRFALAYARASMLNSDLAFAQGSQERKSKARAQAEEALRLSPTLGEAHMALGLCLYEGDKTYGAALKELEVAAATSPNNAWIYIHVGIIYRRQGRWREAIASFDRALSLDPLNKWVVFHAALNHLFTRDWPAAAAGFTHVVEIDSTAVSSRISLAYLEVVRSGNLSAAKNILQRTPAPASPDPYKGSVALARWDLAMLERDYTTAEKIWTDFPSKDLFDQEGSPKTFYQGRTALARGDSELAQRCFAATLPVLEGWMRKDSDDPERHSTLGLLYAYMGRKADAIREGRRAIELEPETENAMHGPARAAHLALVYALTGEQDQAITLVERLLSTPGPVGQSEASSNITLADLRLRWEWDSLRSNPRFQKILAGPEPKTVY
jgi:serine/threonine protein kinase/tetratricopeptide (TPR) repeat protein